jgi:hypothetical protein
MHPLRIQRYLIEEGMSSLAKQLIRITQAGASVEFKPGVQGDCEVVEILLQYPRIGEHHRLMNLYTLDLVKSMGDDGLAIVLDTMYKQLKRQLGWEKDR